MVWQLSQPCHGCFWRGISNVRNSRSLNLMTAHKNKQHIKKILLSKTQLQYLSKLAYIVLSHQYTDLGCARQNMSQRCPELTKFLPNCDISAAPGLSMNRTQSQTENVGVSGSCLDLGQQYCCCLSYVTLRRQHCWPDKPPKTSTSPQQDKHTISITKTSVPNHSLAHNIQRQLKYRVIFFTGTPQKSTEKLIQARLGVSRTIYVTVDSPNLGFPYFNFGGWGVPVKKITL